MKLKRLDIKGFKSFANDTSIHFNDEIIGIVGPNGSGKSNIVDAIRWVLGEQKSKELRLEKMVDVIFNGTKSKRRASMAKVTMTFENSSKLIPLEYDNVSVSRILYDTNESEYRLNDVPCRLKDIRDLFLDTGIGSNSYAIIELGMVDDILMDKDNARRKMFEQAAGISKYKVRKRETLNKLKNTQNDLDRIEDILFELQSNLKSLEKQARRTKRYYDLKEEYKQISVQKTAINQKQALEQKEVLRLSLDKAKAEFVELTAKVNNLEAELESLKTNNLDGEKELSAKQKEFNGIIEELRRTESQLEIKKQNKQFLEQNKKRVENSIEEFARSQDQIESSLNNIYTQLEKLESESPAIKNEFLKTQSDFESIDNQRLQLQDENNTLLEALKTAENKRFELEKRLVQLRSNYENKLSNRKTGDDDRIENLNILSGLESEATKLQESIDTELSVYQELKEKLGRLEADKQSIQDKLAAEKENLNRANRQLDALTNEHDLLKDMVDNLEGFPESAKFLVKKWHNKKPLLSDVMECEEQYRPAIEAYLESYLSYFILDTVEEARSSIELLRQAQKGKSQFFILSSFENYDTNVINLSQYGKAAVNVVKCDSKYEKLIYHLLSKVVIIEDEALLNNVMPDDELVYLSSSGYANRTKHVISGGSVGLFDGKRIGRKKELSKLRDKIAKTQKNIQGIENRIEQLNDKNKKLTTADINSELETKSNLLNQLEKRKVEIETRLNNVSSTLTNLAARNKLIDDSLNSDKKEIEDSERQLTEVLKEVEEQRFHVENQSGKMENISKDYSIINARYTEAQLSWVKHQNELEGLRKESQLRTQQLNESKSKNTMANDELQRLAGERQQNAEDIERLEKELLAQAQLRDTKQLELNEKEQSFFASRSVIHEKEETLKQETKRLQNQQLLINEQKDKLTGIEFELKSAIERIKIEFGIDAKSLDVEVPEEAEEIEALEERYIKLKKRLDNYGEINPMAVEAYDEMLERFETMESQRNDIIEARDSLNKTIGEIDSEATKMFLDSFHKVKDHFKEVFRSLFSDEDDCDLILFNLENPLESDIEIVAKPKGKRPKVLSQLSGGEKTLTATALLFSLYLLKPAPFCIFDEVDAPLDDINIQKFSKLIRRFSNESQFIIITHNKSTMAAMDTLYGVYMQEQGVSGITQVDFREYEHNEMFRTVNLQ